MTKIYSFKLKNPTKAKVSIRIPNPQFSVTLNPESESDFISGAYLTAIKPYIQAFGLTVLNASPGEVTKPVDISDVGVIPELQIEESKPAEVGLVSEVETPTEDPPLALREEVLARVYDENELRSMIKAQLSEILRDRGISPFGNKDELVARVLDSQSM